MIPHAQTIKTTLPVTWTIAGSDSGGGAGIQADLKTITNLGTHACSVITAVTAQNTQQVLHTVALSSQAVQQQLTALQVDLPCSALKTGMLANAAIVNSVVDFFNETFHSPEARNSAEGLTNKPKIVCDPVILSTSGDCLLEQEAIQVILDKLLPWVDVLTPNLAEAQLLASMPIETPADIERAAKKLLDYGVNSVLIKGGHSVFGNPTENMVDGDNNNLSEICRDFWTDGHSQLWVNSPRQPSENTHGTGCTLSAAITAALALQYSIADAVIIGKAYVNQGIRLAPNLGNGHGPLAFLQWPETPADMPTVTKTIHTPVQRKKFPDCGPLGFYPIVNRAHWLGKLLPLGVSTIQLRIKDLSGDALAAEIESAVAISKQYDCQLFINDYWQLALSCGAYGVHLGQSDLDTADLDAIASAGLRLGVSTHCYYEVGRALAVNPSYIAVGPIFETTTKSMAFKPQGLAALKRWRSVLANYPMVAIAGIFLDNAEEVLDCGVDSVAVVREISECPPAQLESRVNAWLNLLSPEARMPQKASRLQAAYY
ncbi:MAG: bifunctional hydroxymethylpyrimidine kinase/phosphomethylpyrimidine kinase [Cyanobacteria bacterium P01_H01_bin.74]